MTIANQNIRNFSIIAHIDHGKSTLSDCFIRYCDGLSDREMEAFLWTTKPEMVKPII